MSLVESANSQDQSTRHVLMECKEQHASVLSMNPYITTMTACFFLSQPPKSIDMIAEYVAQPPSELGRSLIDEVFGGKELFYARPRSKCFPNCIVFTLIEDTCRKLAIKCFTNGTLHITGVKSMQRGLEIADMFCALLDLVEGGDGCNTVFQVERFELQLMNLHFQVDVGVGSLNLARLFRLVLQQATHASSYNKERHNGLIIKFLSETMHTVSIIVFDSGNILICACKDGSSFKEAFGFIIGILQDVWNDVWQKDLLGIEVGKKRKRRAKDHFDYGQYVILS